MGLVWRPGVGPPSMARLGDQAYTRLTLSVEVADREAADWPRARPNFDIRPHNWRHIDRQDSARSGAAMGETWRGGNGVASWIT